MPPPPSIFLIIQSFSPFIHDVYLQKCVRFDDHLIETRKGNCSASASDPPTINGSNSSFFDEPKTTDDAAESIKMINCFIM